MPDADKGEIKYISSVLGHCQKILIQQFRLMSPTQLTLNLIIFFKCKFNDHLLTAVIKGNTARKCKIRENAVKRSCAVRKDKTEDNVKKAKDI